MAEGIDIIIDEAKTATKRAYKKSGAEDLSGTIKDTLRGAPVSQGQRGDGAASTTRAWPNSTSWWRPGSSTAGPRRAAFLIGEGAAARAQLFERIAEKTDMIRKVKEELRSLVNEEPAETPRAPSGDKADA